ncbi:hypothetical protein BYT27DRAFT_7096379 [Phlegmacium glaucopus]|nr:hypothetical protein BYT27DRAFT_7096379 [Phlegmacium glaucopus]
MSINVSITASNRNMKNLPMGPNGREWSNDLSSCCGDCSTWPVAFICPCITYARVKRRYKYLNSRGHPDPERGECCSYECCSCECCCHAMALFFCMGWAWRMCTRSDIRKRYSIRGGCCSDCGTACCCTTCELVQESRELELEELTYPQGIRWKR